MESPVYIRPLLALLVTVAIIGVTTVVIRNGSLESKPVSPAIQQLPQNIDIALNKARFSEIQDGLLVWELFADRAEYDKIGDTVYLRDVRMEFRKTASQGAITVTAGTGEYFITKNDISLKGNVHVVTDDAAQFITEAIFYKGAADHFTTEAPVTFSQQRIQLNATGMDLAVKGQKAYFKSSVVATIVAN